MAKIICITGPPCSGKSTYVAEHKGDEDIVFDYDEIFKAVSFKPTHSNANQAEHNLVMSLRERWIYNAKKSNAKNAFLICTRVNDYLKKLIGEDFKEVAINSTYEECMQHLENAERPDKNFEIEKINKFFNIKAGDKEQMKIEVRNNNEVVISGYVNAVERKSELLSAGKANDAPGNFREIIKQGVFKQSLAKNPKVILKINHKKIIGDTETNLELTEDTIGLHAKATITDPETIKLINEGKIKGWSFGMENPKSNFEKNQDGTYTRTISELDLVEVSILTIDPAYPACSVEIRNYANFFVDNKNKEKELEILKLKGIMNNEKS